MVKALSRILTSEHKKESWKGHGKKGQATLTEVMLRRCKCAATNLVTSGFNALNTG